MRRSAGQGWRRRIEARARRGPAGHLPRPVSTPRATCFGGEHVRAPGSCEHPAHPRARRRTRPHACAPRTVCRAASVAAPLPRPPPGSDAIAANMCAPQILARPRRPHLPTVAAARPRRLDPHACARSIGSRGARESPRPLRPRGWHPTAPPAPEPHACARPMRSRRGTRRPPVGPRRASADTRLVQRDRLSEILDLPVAARLRLVE